MEGEIMNKWTKYINERFNLSNESGSFVVALAGNPNTGKSTVFNALTGMKQHTGNWPGKTVVQSQGSFILNGQLCTLVDLPGTYSLLSTSLDELVARDFLCFANPDATIVVTDATCLERNLNLVLQVMEITKNVVVCVNLMDEAKRKNINIDLDKLSSELGVPVVGTVARNRKGLNNLMATVYKVATAAIEPNPRLTLYDDIIEKNIKEIEPSLDRLLKGRLNSRWVALRLIEGDTTFLEGIKDYLSYFDADAEVKMTCVQ
ncbi:MAG: iron transporter FeoB [Desulfitibacter sp. BRH_c19]|nr:MAG: iron transporter FeoB [Desulfitibacter sp. BRH_c19]